jgi:hypothetical protein
MNKARAKHYRWTNVVVLVVSVYLLASSVWHPPEMVEQGVQSPGVYPIWLTVAYVLAGVAGISAVFLSIKRRWLGRALTALAGVLILSGFLAVRNVTPLALISMGVSALALLIASFFMGPMPTPEQEGLRR